MSTGGLAQMTSNNFISPAGGLASRRGGQSLKPLSIDGLKQAGVQDGGVPTPRTSRSHLLAGLRTAPKSATATSFSNLPGDLGMGQRGNGNGYSYAQNNAYNPPKSAFPQYGQQNHFFAQQQQQQLQQQQLQQQQQQQQQQQYTVDQVLAPPQIAMDEQLQEQMDPNLYAQLVATNMYLAQQQQRLQQQLRSVQAAAQQFQQLNVSNPQLTQQQMALYEQQQQLAAQAAVAQGQQVYFSPVTGQYYVDNSAAANQMAYADQPMTPGVAAYQQQQQLHQQAPPRVQVSPPPENQPAFRSNSPPKRYESPSEVTPLPPPSANAFRRGHKKATSIAPVNSALSISATGETIKSPGPKTSSIPLTPMMGGYGPGQARAGEHPVRQPRGPPSMDELKSKPTAKHEGSKNFAARTRRSAVHNLVRAGLERRKGSGSSSGSMTPVSETAEESATPITDNESDSGRSGSGSLAGEMECNSSRTSASGSWGAIGSDRPSSRQKTRNSVDSVGSDAENNSFAEVFKHGAIRTSKANDAAEVQRKTSKLVLKPAAVA